jgi:hypothetical protein
VDYQSQIRHNNSATLTTYANGVYPRIAGYGRIENATSANSSIAVANNNGFDTTFEVSMNMRVNSSPVIGVAITTNCSYTDEGNVSRVVTLPVTTTDGNWLNNGTIAKPGVFESATIHIRVKGYTTVTLYTAGTFPGGVNYNAEGYIRQLSRNSNF